MINLKVNKNYVEQNIDGRLTDIMTELIIGATVVMKIASKNAKTYTEFRDAFVATVASYEYDDLNPTVKHDRDKICKLYGGACEKCPIEKYDCFFGLRPIREGVDILNDTILKWQNKQKELESNDR